jgi:deazaflavin-dependent oxidoreductase (nitroreductase family)
MIETLEKPTSPAEFLPDHVHSHATSRARSLLIAGFRTFNRWAMLPLLDAGLGPWMGTPIGGWLLVLRVRGRKSGLVREVPLSYLIAEGSAWVMAGFGDMSEWYRNLLADPSVEILLPGRSVRCAAVPVGDEATRARILPRLVRAAGVPGYLTGCDPYRAPAAALLAATAGLPLIRLQPVAGPLVAGPDDPGGTGWIWRQALVALLTIATLSRVAGVARRRPGPSG